MAKTKGLVEQMIYDKRDVPAPGRYIGPKPFIRHHMPGKFNESVGKTDVEWQIYRSSQLPGPGQYQPLYTVSSSGTLNPCFS